MSGDVWIGAVTTLAGAALGGLISFALSRQQINEARRQRVEQARLTREESSRERRLDCYAGFLSQARAYRNAVRSLGRRGSDVVATEQFDTLAAEADAASSQVFLLVESSDTYEACRSVVGAIGLSQKSLHAAESRSSASDAREINESVAASLRRFQVAARDELGVLGVDKGRILGEYTERDLSREPGG
jgi:hypothetical protein